MLIGFSEHASSILGALKSCGFIDEDGDSYSPDLVGVLACAAPGPDYMPASENLGRDCDDADPTVHPGAEEVCGDEYEQMLQLLHEDEVFAPVDLDVQERAVDAIKDALTEDQQTLVDDLVDNQSRHVWLQQEAAFHLGLAIGMRLAEAGPTRPAATSAAAQDGA